MEGRPAIPSSIDQVQVEGEWAVNGRWEEFLMFQTSGSYKIVGSATKQMLKKLCDSPFVIMDGTSRFSLLLFKGLYILHG